MLTLLTVNIVSASEIQGRVYDFSLEKLSNVIVEINTNPMQRQVSKTGFYSFNVPNGNYTISIKNAENKIIGSENILINEEGNYTLDIITFIDLGEEQELVNDTSLELNTDIENIDKTNYSFIWIILVVLILAILSYYLIKRNKKELQIVEDDLKNKVLEIIKKEDGRTTQKEIRKLIPYSEAKISLVITELEAEGKVQKIKKGRSNVIILKK